MSSPDVRRVFLSHNSIDKPEVEALADRLRAERNPDGQPDIEPWLDKWHIIPGQPSVPALEAAIRDCHVCLVFIGKGDHRGIIGPWQNLEVQALIAPSPSPMANSKAACGCPRPC
jgi:TIR domain